jgi:hypothetical protein
MALRVVGRFHATCALAAIALCAAPAAAQSAGPRQSPEAVREATSLFATGSDLYRKKSYAEALAAFQKSHDLVQSPNSALYIARCLRELGRTADAAAEYDEVEREAAGNSRYDETTKAAASESAELRAKLGTVNVRVAHLPAGGQVLVDGAPVKPVGESFKAYHAPGTFTVTLRASPAPDEVKSVSVDAGGRVDLELDAAASRRPAWMVPTIVAAGGVGVIGLGMAIGFGASSRAIFNDLRATCGSRCTTPGEQDQIATGKRNQAIANGALVFGLAGAAVATTVGVLLWQKRSGRVTASVDVGPGHVSIAGRF